MDIPGDSAGDLRGDLQTGSRGDCRIDSQVDSHRGSKDESRRELQRDSREDLQRDFRSNLNGGFESASLVLALRSPRTQSVFIRVGLGGRQSTCGPSGLAASEAPAIRARLDSGSVSQHNPAYGRTTGTSLKLHGYRDVPARRPWDRITGWRVPARHRSSCCSDST
jgi:hypothetical protein